MMRQLIVILMALAFVVPQQLTAQTSAQRRKARTAKVAKGSRNTKKKAASSKQRRKKKTKKTRANDYSTKEIKGLRNERSAVRRKIKEQERLLRANKSDVKKRLGNLLVLNGEIDRHKKSIDAIQTDINGLDGNISLLNRQLSTLEAQLKEHKARYIKSMRYMARHRTIQDRLMFVFSADNFAQMYRRMRFVREYAAYQRAQGEMVKDKQRQIGLKHKELNRVRGQKNTLLNKGRQEQAALQVKQTEQQDMVKSLQRQQKTIQAVIDDQRKKDAALNGQIDRLVAIEVAKAKARAEEEARKRAAAAAEAKRRREAELARKKAAAEAAARENARRVAEAKAREERLKAEARAAEKKSGEERERARQAAREAEASREAAERKAAVDRKRHAKEVAEAREKSQAAATLSSVDRKLSQSFAANRGRLPMPISGSYKIVSHYGQYNVEGLKNVKLDNKGINILGSPGASARAIFDGEVSAVFGFSGQMVVMVRHGNYISVYCNLRSVSVHRGQHVSTRQALGTVGDDNILQFQLRQNTAKLNPEVWLGR